MASSKFLLFVVFVISLSCIANSHVAQKEKGDSYVDNKFRPRIPPYGGRGVELGGHGGLRGSGGLRGGGRLRVGSGLRSGGGLRGGSGLGGGPTFGGGTKLGGSVGLVGGGGNGFGGVSLGFSGGGELRSGVGLGGHDSFAHDSAREAKLGGTDRGDFEGDGEANNIKSSDGSGGKV